MNFVLAFLIGVAFAAAGMAIGGSYNRPVLGWFLGSVCAMFVSGALLT